MNLWSCQTFISFMALMNCAPALMVYVVDQLIGHTIPIELSPDATVRDLKQQIASSNGMDANSFVLSFQGEALTDPTTPLADTGLSNQCMLSMIRSTVIELTFDGSLWKLNDSDLLLRWDTARDITQFAWLHEMVNVGFYFEYRINGMVEAVVKYVTDGKSEDGTPRIAKSHSFWIVPRDSEDAKQAEHLVEGTNYWFLPPLILSTPKYAKDIFVAHSHGGNMQLTYVSASRHAACYRFPDGYGLLLRYNNGSRMA